jgi:uncharacterized membrane protein YhaH (DUF805 family)
MRSRHERYLDTMLRYFEFSGRTSRGQYWIYQLVMFVLVLIAIGIDVWSYKAMPGANVGLFTIFAVIIHVIPSLTISIRRLHDIGKSGWWYLISYLPFGGFLLLVWSFYASEPGTNEYGPPNDTHATRPSVPSFRRGSTLDAIEARRSQMRRQF